MEKLREIAVVSRGLLVPEGDPPIRRYLGTPELPDLDPFLLLDWFEVDNAAEAPNFAPHPHRGIETLTLMLEGGMEHFDNLGNVQPIGPGGAQVMRAGQGILHAERPLPASGRLFGLQLWLNLSARDKALAPDYQGIAAGDVPEDLRDGVTVRVLMGRSNGSRSPVRQRPTDPQVLDCLIHPGARIREPVEAPRAGFVLVVSGEIALAGTPLARGMFGVLGPGDGIEMVSQGGGRVLVFSGVPVGEPIVRSGPFVMTTRRDVLAAYDDYQSGKFGPSISTLIDSKSKL